MVYYCERSFCLGYYKSPSWRPQTHSDLIKNEYNIPMRTWCVSVVLDNDFIMTISYFMVVFCLLSTTAILIFCSYNMFNIPLGNTCGAQSWNYSDHIMLYDSFCLLATLKYSSIIHIICFFLWKMTIIFLQYSSRHWVSAALNHEFMLAFVFGSTRTLPY